MLCHFVGYVPVSYTHLDVYKRQDAMCFREGWVMVNRVPTRVLTWGGWIENKLPDSDCIVVCISGNPGVTTFYSTFLSAINKQLDCPVWIVNHAGKILKILAIDI